MPRGRQPGPPKTRFEVRIDKDLAERFNRLFVDSFTGNLAKGPRSKAIEALIREFVEKNDALRIDS